MTDEDKAMLTAVELIERDGVRIRRTWALLAFTWNPVFSYQDEQLP
jgi:hypothetical protein